MYAKSVLRVLLWPQSKMPQRYYKHRSCSPKNEVVIMPTIHVAPFVSFIASFRNLSPYHRSTVSHSRVQVMVQARSAGESESCGHPAERTTTLTHPYIIPVDRVQFSNPGYRTPIGGRGPRLLWLLCAESMLMLAPLSPLPALALALPVRLRTFLPLLRALTPACCSTCCGATVLPCPGGYRGTGCRTSPGGEGRPFIGGPIGGPM
jgi:hypothetical protein